MSNDFIIQDNIKREQQRFFINTIEISGVQSVDGNYVQNLIPLKFLGMANPELVPQGPQQGNFSVSTLVVGQDKFIQHTGLEGFNGYVLKSRTDTTQNFSFLSGYLTTYQSNCSIGEIPKINVSFDIFGNIGCLSTSDSTALDADWTTIASESSDFSPMIAGPGSITISLDDFTNNRVLSYDINININRNPIYPLGSRIPIRVEINWPIEITCSFNFVVNNYVAQKSFNAPNNPKIQNLTLVLKSFDNDETIVSYNFNNLTLTEERHSTSVDGQIEVQAIYKGYLGRPG